MLLRVLVNKVGGETKEHFEEAKVDDCNGVRGGENTKAGAISCVSDEVSVGIDVM